METHASLAHRVRHSLHVVVTLGGGGGGGGGGERESWDEGKGKLLAFLVGVKGGEKKTTKNKVFFMQQRGKEQFKKYQAFADEKLRKKKKHFFNKK